MGSWTGTGATPTRLAPANFNQRIHYAPGEYDERPDAGAGLSEEYLDCATEASCQAFLVAARPAGETCSGPSGPHGPTKEEEKSWRAAVRIGEFALSPQFVKPVDLLQTLAGVTAPKVGGASVMPCGLHTQLSESFPACRQHRPQSSSDPNAHPARTCLPDSPVTA